jgi:hypothetical protein
MTKNIPKIAKSWRKLKKVTRKTGKKGTKVDRSDVPLVSPPVIAAGAITSAIVVICLSGIWLGE